MHPALSYLGWVLSPSRKIVDIWKRKRNSPAARGDVLRSWNLVLFIFEVSLGIVLSVASELGLSYQCELLGYSLAIYAYSRCNEISYAFYNDAISRLEQEDAETNLSPTDRIRMAMKSYVGLAVNFAVLYYFIPVPKLFGEATLNGFFESLYFSGVTLATLGYGDVVPKHWLARSLALYEVFAGILLVAVAIATYVGGALSTPPKEPDA